jgi:Flp pilus assembly protein TadD
MSEQQLPADREGSGQTARAEARQKMSWWLVLGLVVPWLLLAVVVAGGAWWWWQQSVVRRAAVEAALAEAESLRDRSRYAEALAVLEQAERMADGSTRKRLREALADLRLVQGLEDIRARAVELKDGRMNWPAVDQDYEAVFREAGVGVLEEPAEEVATRVRGSTVRGALVAGVDDWAARTQDEVRRAWLLEVARRADPGPGVWGERFRDPAVWRDRAKLERLAQDADVSGLSPQTLFALALALQKQGGDAVPLLRAAQELHPADFWLNFQLGASLTGAKRFEEAMGCFRAAAALRPTSVAVHTNLGYLLAEQGHLEEAVASYRRAIALDPRLAQAHMGLGLVLVKQGKLEEAVACLRQTIALNPKLALAHNNLGDALKQQGKLDEARECQRRAIELDPGLARPEGNKR